MCHTEEHIGRATPVYALNCVQARSKSGTEPEVLPNTGIMPDLAVPMVPLQREPPVNGLILFGFGDRIANRIKGSTP